MCGGGLIIGKLGSNLRFRRIVRWGRRIRVSSAFSSHHYLKKSTSNKNPMSQKRDMGLYI